MSSSKKIRSIKPIKGYDWNPLLIKETRNLACICGSGKKFKRCCRPKVSKVVPLEVALRMKDDTTHAIDIYMSWLETEVDKPEKLTQVLEVPKSEINELLGGTA